MNHRVQYALLNIRLVGLKYANKTIFYNLFSERELFILVRAPRDPCIEPYALL